MVQNTAPSFEDGSQDKSPQAHGPAWVLGQGRKSVRAAWPAGPAKEAWAPPTAPSRPGQECPSAMSTRGKGTSDSLPSQERVTATVPSSCAAGQHSHCTPLLLLLLARTWRGPGLSLRCLPPGAFSLTGATTQCHQLESKVKQPPVQPTGAITHSYTSHCVGTMPAYQLERAAGQCPGSWQVG